MLYEEREKNLIDAFAELSDEELCFLSESKIVKKICNSLRDSTVNCNWIDSSGKGDLPPDFYNDVEKLMMDVMRVDDHSIQGRKKILNANRARQHELEKEIRQKIGDGLIIPDLIINAVTDLPTREDHNYIFYRDDFKRTIENHISKIERYKCNHPGYSVIFFVYDESSAYFECERDAVVCSPQGEPGNPHLWFLDKAFLDVFLNTEIDYLIWFTPYKWFEKIEPPCILPKACIFDCKTFPYRDIEYRANHMASAEK